MTPSEFEALVPLACRARFVAKVQYTDTCWLWTGAKDSDGYGVFTPERRQRKVHRLSYTWAVGEIGAGLTIDHVKTRGCTSRACFKPAHLEPVTNRVNILRGAGPAAVNANKTACPKGHPLTEDNVFYSPPGSKGRRCRACSRAWSATPSARASRARCVKAKRAYYNAYASAYGRRKRAEATALRGPRAERTHCKNGHELAGDNLLERGKGFRCRTCRNASALAAYYRSKAKKEGER